MKNIVFKYKIEVFDFWSIIIGTILTIGLLIPAILINSIPGIIILSLIFLLFIYGLFFKSKFYILFDYQNKQVRSKTINRFKKIIVNMEEVKNIKLFEDKTVIHFGKYSFFNNDHISKVAASANSVYDNGKNYIIKIEKNNGEIIKLSYKQFYRCRDKEELRNFEKDFNNAIKQFYEFQSKLKL